jgi:hypothetical protein
MRTYQIIIATFILLESCDWQYKKINITEAMKPVHLDSIDLAAFSQLKQQLIKDLPAIMKQNEITNGSNHSQYTWISTNLYYLNQLDSFKYSNIYSHLKRKPEENIHINKKGGIIFAIKRNVQLHKDTYNEAYEHLLISSDCNCPTETIYNNIDTVYIDSTINKEWKYISLKNLTGH